MLRTALKPRWLGLLAFVLAVMVSFGMLGLWQLNVARDKGRAEALTSAPQRPVAELTAVLTPHDSFPADGSGRRVTVTGRYDASGQVLVAPRLLRGEGGSWVVTPLVVEGTGARLAVVRGFVRDASATPGPPSAAGTTVTGALAPGESPADAASSRPGGQLGSLDLSVLVNRWPGELYNAFVFATGESSDSTSVAGSAITRVPPPSVGASGLSWRNAAYASQWWIFALFAAYMWWRMVRDDTQGARQQACSSARQRRLSTQQQGESTNV